MIRRPASDRVTLPPRCDRDPKGHVTIKPRPYDWSRER